MKKRLLIGLTAGTVLVWSSVLVLWLDIPGIKQDMSREQVTDHSPSLSAVKSLDDQSTSGFLNREGTSRHIQSSNKLKTLMYSKRWIDDVEEDGKLSIDTLLESMNLRESTAKSDNG
ncbi:hypothetical protein [Halobacillus litoralis]|uniref:hypothetical protein n=1 Tax=Halobacillus litoralis TaxID=45668 RepID=UPI001CFE6FEE|nr:hypothetical protein [Halobacillus litoralis]